MAMELQLGLALPTNPTKGFDLNTYVHDHKDAFDQVTNTNTNTKKRAFDHSSAFHQTLPLLLWNDQPNDGDDDPKDLDRAAFSSNERDDEEENGLVGWPPLKKRRKRLYMQKRGGQVAENRRQLENNGCGFYRAANSRYVKVKMEGVGIARKVDLSLYHSFAALRATLMYMFDETDPDSYRLAYQTMAGDWLLADDVTWRNFTRTAQRIKLEKNYYD